MLYDILGLKYKHYDPNPVSNIKDKKDYNDCVIRALSKILNMSWEEIYDELADVGKKNGYMMISNQCVYDVILHHGLGWCDEFTDGTVNLNNENAKFMLIGEFLHRIKDNDVECVVSSRDHAIYFKNDTVYDKADPEDFSDRIFMEKQIAQPVSWFVVKRKDADKIMELVFNTVPAHYLMQ